MVKGQGHWKR